MADEPSPAQHPEVLRLFREVRAMVDASIAALERAAASPALAGTSDSVSRSVSQGRSVPDSAPAVDAVVSPRTATATASVGAVAVVVANAEVVEGTRAALGQLVTQGLITLDIAANLDGLTSFCERVAELVQRIIP